MNKPLAEMIRPKCIDDVVGQKHLLSEGALLRRLIESGAENNMIFYGPSGTGKTTIANIIASNTNKTLYKMNATTASISDVKSVIADIGTLAAPGGILLYLDEIQYFNKKQQQSLLEFIENGTITLIASTTENPYFTVYNAILSRCSVFEFKPLPAEDVEIAVQRALCLLKKEQPELSWEENVPHIISVACGGDGRKAMNAVEVLFHTAQYSKGQLWIKENDAKEATQRSSMRYDRDGDDHYDLLSALQKSIRGSDPDAAVYYLAQLLISGDLLSPCRRLLVIAAEDIGLAYPSVIPIVKACVDSALQVGLPEARIPLADAAILLSTSPKSNSGNSAIESAWYDIEHGKVGEIPRHLKNVHADSTGEEFTGQYLYPHDYPNHYIKQQYLPDICKDAHYYSYGDNKMEQTAKQYWEKIK